MKPMKLIVATAILGWLAYMQFRTFPDFVGNPLVVGTLAGIVFTLMGYVTRQNRRDNGNGLRRA